MALKLPYRSLAYILCFLAVLVLMKNVVLKYMITAGTSKAVGVNVEAGRVHWSLTGGKLTVEDLKIYNPEGFDEDPMVYVDSLAMDYSIAAITRRVPVINELEINIREIVVVKNADGDLNVNALTLNNDDESEDKRREGPAFPVDILKLKLNIGQLVQKDYSKGDEPIITAHDIGLTNKEFNDVPGVRKILAIVLFHSLKKTSFKGIKVYGLATFLGTGFLPAGAAAVLIAKDHAENIYDGTADEVYPKVLEALQSIGNVEKEDPKEGLIEAGIDGHQVFVRVENVQPEHPEQSVEDVKITVSARKLTLPKPQFAGGILYQIVQYL